jgi:hypothetical protein
MATTPTQGDNNMTTIMAHIKTKQFSFNGRLADVQTFKFGKSSFSERVVVYKFTDNGEMRIKHISGDGRTKNFQMFSEVTIANGTDIDIENTLNTIIKK